jgi:hypothetical protein
MDGRLLVQHLARPEHGDRLGTGLLLALGRARHEQHLSQPGSGNLPVSLTVTNATAQGSQSLMLQSGGVLDHVTLEQTAANGGLFETCVLVGDAIPAS